MKGDDISVIKIERDDEPNGNETTEAYIFDITQYLFDGQVCAGVVHALSEVLEQNPNEMVPLHSVVDCDALTMLFRTTRYGELRDDVSVTFPYDVYEVTVHSDGRVVVQS